jgi:MFS transporter, UMF1 family
MRKNNSKTIFGWCMYDWANSAYSTTVAAGLLPVYFATVVVGSDGFTIGGTTFSATTLWGIIVGMAALTTFLVTPVLGAIADFANAKKRFLLLFAYTGSLFTLFLYFSKEGDVLSTLIIFFITQVCFIGANVFYDAFLPHICTNKEMDMISSKGFSYGYIGGGLQFALTLALVAGHNIIGISQPLAVRIGILGAGLWWAGFTIFTAKNLIEARGTSSRSEHQRDLGLPPFAYARVGFSRLIETTKHVRRFRHLVLFLIAYMLYNDAIQTVLDMATIYGAEELKLSATPLLVTLLIIQVVAAIGAFIFGRFAALVGTKRAVMTTLALWSLIVVYGYFITTTYQFFAAGVMVGIVMGGSQALSRSFYGSMIPKEASAEFYGFYTVFSKFSAIWGPFVFAFIRQTTGSARNSILSLVVFFIVGLVLLYFVDEKKAREAKLAGAF